MSGVILDYQAAAMSSILVAPVRGGLEKKWLRRRKVVVGSCLMIVSSPLISRKVRGSAQRLWAPIEVSSGVMIDILCSLSSLSSFMFACWLLEFYFSGALLRVHWLYC